MEAGVWEEDCAGLLQAAAWGVPPDFWQRVLLRASTRPFSPANIMWLRSSLAQEAVGQMLRCRWMVRVATPRNYLLWRQGALMCRSAVTTVVLPDLFGRLSRGEWTALCLMEMLHRLGCVGMQAERAGRAAALFESQALDDYVWTALARERLLECDGMAALPNFETLLHKVIYPGAVREFASGEG